MTGVDRANGHKPAGISPLHHPALADAPRPDPAKLAYDLNEALSAVVPLQARTGRCIFRIVSWNGTGGQRRPDIRRRVAVDNRVFD